MRKTYCDKCREEIKGEIVNKAEVRLYHERGSLDKYSKWDLCSRCYGVLRGWTDV